MNFWLALALIFALMIAWVASSTGSKEDLSGYGVTSAMHFYNRNRYCDPPGLYGSSYSGGCFLPHRVIF